MEEPPLLGVWSSPLACAGNLTMLATCGHGDFMRLRGPYTPVVAAGLMLAVLLVTPPAVRARDDQATSSTLDSRTRSALDKALDEGFAASGMPGTTVGLWIPGHGSWVASRGVADLETRRPMTPDLQAPIGSITKTFTVLIALHLVGQGSLRLDDTIDHWYPWIADASLITVKMVMNHSSGIADIAQQQARKTGLWVSWSPRRSALGSY
jgi:D-alanyl-D-alanine carboxypeptidase